MLMVTRRPDEKLVFGDGQRLAIVDEYDRVVEVLSGPIEITTVECHAGKVRFGVDAPPALHVHREEIALARRAERADGTAA